jgi:hypothetical protein
MAVRVGRITEEKSIMSTVKPGFDVRVFVPEQPLDLPIGYVVEISLPSPPPPHSEELPLMRLVEILEAFPSDPDMPTDAAAQHDHYLYGTPKRP